MEFLELLFLCYIIIRNSKARRARYATFNRGLAQAEKVGVRGVGLIKFIRVPGEGSAFIYNKKKFLTNENKIEICVLVGGLWRREVLEQKKNTKNKEN
jgi:hypothetical protein